MAASRAGHTEAAQALIAAGADVNALSESSTSALILASQAGHLAVVEALIAAGAGTDLIRIIEHQV